MAGKKIDSDILDRALIFAVKAHSGIERKGKGIPYIVHPAEVAAIVSSITSDQELMAAAALHDVVEDTDTTIEDIRREFGDRVARLVDTETEEKIPGREEETWHARKEKAMNRLLKADRETKIVALGDKLSNMRTIAADYDVCGDRLWERFHTKDPYEHEWHYRRLVEVLSELKDTRPYMEFEYLVDDVFLKACRKFSVKSEGNRHYFRGKIFGEDITPFLKSLDKNSFHIFDFDMAGDITFSGMRAILNAYRTGLKFSIVNLKAVTAKKMNSAGLTYFLNTSLKPQQITLNGWKQSGEGFTAVTYNNEDNDSMLKLYNGFIPLKNIEHEKNIVQAAVKCGINTPLTGQIVSCNGKNGLTFERITDKISIARAVSNEPGKVREYARIFTDMCRKLHSTKCDTSFFPSVKDIYYKILKKSENFTEEEKKPMWEFIEKMPDADTCIHGDLHPGNIKKKKNEPVFIDMADFCYGYPLMDLGATYFCLNCSNDRLCDYLFHCKSALMKEFWSHFAEFYFGADTDEKQAEVHRTMLPYAAMKAVFFGELHKMEPGMKSFIMENLVKPYQKADKNR